MSFSLPLDNPALLAVAVLFVLLVAYLVQLNRLISGSPVEVSRLTQNKWTADLLRTTYRKMEASPITTSSYAAKIPPKLDRRYIVTGGSGLVGGYIVLQLLERGQSPESIRIVDFQRPSRNDMLKGAAANVGYVKTDISSVESTDAAFSAKWGTSVAHLPLTVFHCAAVIVPSDRYEIEAGFCNAVNVEGTRHVVDAAKRAGADVLVSTTSASISIRPVEHWMAPWKMFTQWPRYYAQVLDEKDFFAPLRPNHEFFGNYPASKARAERIVCEANCQQLRTGCVRPANGIYGNPTDNTVGSPLNMGTCPTWAAHIVQSFVHGMNAAIAHLDFEAVLQHPNSASAPQAGRPFVVTDPNPPITYRDLYFACTTLSATRFRLIILPGVLMLLVCYAIEWYTILPVMYPFLRPVMPAIKGPAKHLKPGLFSIAVAHLVATNKAIGASVKDGGLGYSGVITTLDGMAQEIVEWNQEHAAGHLNGKAYTSSVSLADEIQQTGVTAKVTSNEKI